MMINNFTPKAFSQKIFGNNPSIIVTKDPIYLAMIKEDAARLLGQLSGSSDPLSDEQASALLAINELKLDTSLRDALFVLVLKQSVKANQFIEIINKVHDTCKYLSHVTQDGQDNVKSAKISEHAIHYKKAIFLSTLDYLSNPKPSKHSQQAYITQIKQAEKAFEMNATSIDRGIMRKAMKTIVNLILHVSGLFLIANTLNFMLNGNYFFFNDTRSTTVVKNTSVDLISMSTNGIIDS